jgi:dihydrofolate reductase
MPTIALIVAMDKNRLIGAGNQVPWRLRDDMRHFREVTMGKPVIMGRKTYESIPVRFRPLPGRTNIILTRQIGYDAPGCLVTHSTTAALKAAEDAPEVMVIGGAMIYEQFLPQADRIYLTLIDGEFVGDAYFPHLNMDAWQETSREHHDRDEQHSHPFAFIFLERRQKPDSKEEY